MLEPNRRALLFDVLRPPEDHTLDCAVGTTFTLDLLALLTAPVAFTLFDAEDRRDLLERGSLALLESLRRYADRMTVFCHAGQIKIPKGRFPQLEYLEKMVVECLPRVPGAAFHPKIWLLRFKGPEDLVTYRLVCLTRNLTFDQCWDTALTLEGPLQKGRDSTVDANRPLSDFVAALGAFATQPLTAETQDRIKLVADEVKRVAFENPDGIESISFHPFGIGRQEPLPFDRVPGRMLVISPFVSTDGLARLVRGRKNCVLVSRPESLAALKSVPSEITEQWVVHEQAAVGDEDDPPAARGLHAKCYVVDAGSKSSIWTGSANATGGAFNNNVEFLVEMVGPKSRFGIDTVVKARADGASLAEVLQPFSPPLTPREPDDPAGLRSTIDRVRLALANAGLEARVHPSDQGPFRLTLTGQAGAAIVPGKDVVVRCWPATLGRGDMRILPATTEVVFDSLALESLTGFFAFEVGVADGADHMVDAFVLNAPLLGAPPDRRERLLQNLVHDRAGFVRYLQLLLADDGFDLAEAMGTTLDKGAEDSGKTTLEESPSLLESLLRTLSQAPERLDHVASLVADCRKREAGATVFPERFEEIWAPIWSARQKGPE